MKKPTTLLLLLFTILLVSACSGNNEAGPEEEPEPAETEKIKIGFMGPLSGRAANYGNAALDAVQTSLQESEVKDMVEIVTGDSKCDAKEAVTAANKLISAEGVQAIIVGGCFASILAAAPITGENGMAMLTVGSRSPDISEFPNVFRTAPRYDFQGAFVAEMAAERGHSRMAILHESEEYGTALKNTSEKSFPGEGRAVVRTESFERGATDLEAQFKNIKESNPDVLYIISIDPNSSKAALKHAAEMNISLIASESFRSDELKTALRSAEGLTVVAATEGTPEFIKKWSSIKGEPPRQALIAQAYDAFTAIAVSIGQGAGTKEDILDSLRSIRFSGASGNISFDSNGDTQGSYDIYTVRNGILFKEQ